MVTKDPDSMVPVSDPSKVLAFDTRRCDTFYIVFLHEDEHNDHRNRRSSPCSLFYTELPLSLVQMRRKTDNPGQGSERL